ncbi:GntR family transcriptional regulator [Rhizobium sp. RU36D]|uniref:GntR family transcriptional regulator n=1 Tax=Rhizobium sp. RU36D TaxID=1907415 RepID=UPI0009D89E9B|nr:GntR family transcriptional regulator [Rhizobium sp. RU36D]SMD12112.1 transcriptional regulator, GntR family [Rhizobium sp. RU36D]
MKSDTIYKKAFNHALDLLESMQTGAEMPTENQLAMQLDISRTTVRKVLAAFTACGLVSTALPRIKLRSPGSSERFPDAETVPISAQVEKNFMQWILKDDPRPGTLINELELARKFGIATTIIREFLNRFQRFGLIEKRNNTGWVFRGFTKDFALELFEVREMYELRSARLFAGLDLSSPLWRELAAIRVAHVELLDDIDTRFQDFSELDSHFHRLISSASPNRFIDSFSDVMSLVFHYHYQWRKHDERQRNEVAIKEHLAYIDALASRDPERIEAACRAHLLSARATLLRSTEE